MRNRGFTLIEVLIAIVLMAILATALTRILLSDSRFVSQQEAMITARQTARAAKNVMSVDLRMVSDSGLLAVSADSVYFRSPFAYGMACTASGGERIVSLLPTDSAMYASAIPGGLARRRTGMFSFVEGITVTSSANTAACTADSVRVIPDGFLAGITPDTAAMSGEIIPEPLAIAPIVISFPPIFVLTAICLWVRSVVIMAFAMLIAWVFLLPKHSADLLMPDFIFAMGR